MRNMPKVCCGAYTECHVVIDCTEVFIECLGNLTARSSGQIANATIP